MSIPCLLSHQKDIEILEIPLPYENSFNQYNNPYNHEKFIGICSEYGVSNDLTKWRNQKYFSTWQSRAWKTDKPGMWYINENSFSRWIIEKLEGLTTLGLQKLSETVRDYRCSMSIPKYLREYGTQES